MSPLQIIREAEARTLTTEDGERIELEFLPPLSKAEIDEFAAQLPCPLPGEMLELLGHCRGFYGTIEQVDFTGRDLMFEFPAVFPFGVPIAADGFGNFWVVDLNPDSIAWGPIWFACHDPPVVLYQAESVERFLVELFRMFTPPYRSEVDDVHEDRLADVWRTNPGVLSREECLKSGDAGLSQFAGRLDDSYQIIDLQAARPGDGFSWGRYGPKTTIQRHGFLAVFAYQKRAGLFTRIFGR